MNESGRIASSSCRSVSVYWLEASPSVAAVGGQLASTSFAVEWATSPSSGDTTQVSSASVAVASVAYR